jgi:hypothetical protein
MRGATCIAGRAVPPLPSLPSPEMAAGRPGALQSGSILRFNPDCSIAETTLINASLPPSETPNHAGAIEIIVTMHLATISKNRTLRIGSGGRGRLDSGSGGLSSESPSRYGAGLRSRDDGEVVLIVVVTNIARSGKLPWPTAMATNVDVVVMMGP